VATTPHVITYCVVVCSSSLVAGFPTRIMEGVALPIHLQLTASRNRSQERFIADARLKTVDVARIFLPVGASFAAWHQHPV
jgi:hypothetical protein